MQTALVTEFQLAAMARVDQPERSRQDFHLYIDELHNFSTNSFAAILSEARKYRLCMTLSHQYVDQLTEDVRKAVFGNVGNLIAFRAGDADAKIFEREFGNGFSAKYFSDLANHQICAKILTGGEHHDPFSAVTLPPIGTRRGRGDAIVRRSRQKYSIAKAIVEDKIRRWMR
jgi:hypothetical protein